MRWANTIRGQQWRWPRCTEMLLSSAVCAGERGAVVLTRAATTRAP